MSRTLTAGEAVRQRCREGNIPTREFIDFCAFKPSMRTTCLYVGDYLVMPSLTGGLDIEEVAELGYLEPGDFRTVKGTTAPISGNIFIGFDKRGYRVIEGDRIDTGPSSVYETVKLWQRMTRTTEN